MAAHDLSSERYIVPFERQPSAPPQLLRVPEAAAYLKISPRKLYMMLRSGEIRPVRLGASVRVSIRELNAFVGRQEEGDA